MKTNNTNNTNDSMKTNNTNDFPEIGHRWRWHVSTLPNTTEVGLYHGGGQGSWAGFAPLADWNAQVALADRLGATA